MDDRTRLGVIIPAAGASTRYAQDPDSPRSKLDEDLGGRPVLHRTVELFTSDQGDGAEYDILAVIVAGPADDNAFNDFRARHGDKLGMLGVKLIRGGAAHRWQTVKAALAHVPADATHILIHDAARPCTPPELIDRVVRAARIHGAAIPALEVSDTLKRASADPLESHEIDPLDALLGATPATRLRAVEATVDRNGLLAAQTPQVFEADALRSAYAGPDPSGTDDAQVVERAWAGSTRRVAIVDADPRNIKITRPLDLTLARAILGVKGPDSRAAHKRF